MIGNVVLANERDDLFAAPIEQGIHPDHAVTRRDDGETGTDTLIWLTGAQAGDPGDSAGERSAKRFDLANGAAGVARFDRAVESIDPLMAHQGFCSGVVGTRREDASAVSVLGPRPDLEGFREQAPGIERQDVDGEALAEDRMRDRLILQGKARGEHDAAGDDAADRGDTVAEIEAEAWVGRDGGDLRLLRRGEGRSNSLFKDLGNYQGVPRFAERGQLEEAQARSNQQQKWPDRTSGQRGAEKQVIVRRGNVRNPQLTVSGIVTVKIEPLQL
jgi:hypothetical protein